MNNPNEVRQTIKDFSGKSAEYVTSHLKEIGDNESMHKGLKNMYDTMDRFYQNELRKQSIQHKSENKNAIATGIMIGSLVIAGVSSGGAYLWNRYQQKKLTKEQERIQKEQEALEKKFQSQINDLKDQLAESKAKEMSVSEDKIIKEDMEGALDEHSKEDI